MASILRILVDVEPSGPDGWDVTFTAPESVAHGAWKQRRRLLRVRHGGHAFPAVDADAPGLGDPGAPHHDLCVGKNPAALSDLYRRITQRAPNVQGGDVGVFGKYLFHTLIGSSIWEEVLARAGESASDVLELALCWAPEQLDLHRLNWEMMHGPDGFLAARQPRGVREIAITRIVRGADFPARTAQPVPRCMFVIGTSLTDRRIRPGTELLGLLRQIERSGRTIRTRVLRGQNGMGAPPSDIRRVMKEFAPDLVHVICHGEFDQAGNARLELGLDPDDKTGTRMRDSAQLFEYLNEGALLPAIVLLSACNTGQSAAGQNLLAPGDGDGGAGGSPGPGADPDERSERNQVGILGAHETAPLAARLVSRGIPVVIGMAGRVADSACRYFARRFGEALVRGESLVKAVSEGRRAAFAYDERSPEESVDWAFPAVFMSSSVPSDYVPAPLPTGGGPRVEDWVASYHKSRRKEPAFCGRHEFFDAYYDLFTPGQPSVLGAYVPAPAAAVAADAEFKRGLGKTRLLRELTVQAIRDGHLPVVVSSDSETWEPPTTLPCLLTEMYKALLQTRRVFGIDPTDFQIEALMKLEEGRDAVLLPDVEETYIGEARKVNGRVIRDALAADMTYLIREAHKKHGFVRESQGSAILFLDNVDKYPIDFVEEWFDGDVLGTGLRLSSAVRRDGQWDATGTILPVVMTFSMTGASSIILNSVKERGRTLGWIRLEKLDPFPSIDDMDLIAYQNVLLNPYDTAGELEKNVSNCAFALNYESNSDDWNLCVKLVRMDFGGLPGYFSSKRCYTTVMVGARLNFLIAADDELNVTKYTAGPANAGN